MALSNNRVPLEGAFQDFSVGVPGQRLIDKSDKIRDFIIT